LSLLFFIFEKLMIITSHVPLQSRTRNFIAADSIVKWILLFVRINIMLPGGPLLIL